MHSRMLLAMLKVCDVLGPAELRFALRLLFHQRLFSQKGSSVLSSFHPLVFVLCLTTDRTKLSRKANVHLFFQDFKPAPAEMRAKLKVFSVLQPKAQGLSTASHIKKAAGEKISSLVCADHEICDSFVGLSCGSSEWDLSCFWAVAEPTGCTCT